MKTAPGLNVLRGLSALLIVVNHANSDVIPNLAIPRGPVGFALWRVRNLGWSGVDLFFVLGGFLMGATILADLHDMDRVRLARYWKRRATRILPPYYFLLVVLAVTGATGYVDFSSPLSAIRDVLTHALFLNNYLDQLPNGPTWFLAAMVQFYVLIPLFLSLLNALLKWSCSVRLVDSFSKIAIAVILITICLRMLRVVAGTHLPNDFMLTHFRLDAVFIGLLAMHLFRTRHPFVAWLSGHSRISLFLALLSVAPAMFLARKNPFMFSVGFTLLACGYAGMILLIADGALKLTGRAVAFLMALSSWSYSMYLWHYFLPSLLGTPYVRLQHFIHRVAAVENLISLAQTLAHVVVSIVAGYLATALVERPMARLLSGAPEAGRSEREP